MNEHDLLWAMLPEGLENFFELEEFHKTPDLFRIVLKEDNTVPSELPEKYRGKRVKNSILKPLTLDCFPIMGRKTEIIVKRRWWQFEGMTEMLQRKIELTAPGTKLEKEFADFLKEMGGV
jgi:hypothetical protein